MRLPVLQSVQRPGNQGCLGISISKSQCCCGFWRFLHLWVVSVSVSSVSVSISLFLLLAEVLSNLSWPSIPRHVFLDRLSRPFRPADFISISFRTPRLASGNILTSTLSQMSPTPRLSRERRCERFFVSPKALSRPPQQPQARVGGPEGGVLPGGAVGVGFREHRDSRCEGYRSVA